MSEKRTPYDFVKDIEFPKHDLMSEDPSTERDYVPYVVNRALSYHFDCVMFVNEMNRRPLVDKKLQYQYFLSVIRSKRRPANKWAKPIKLDDIEVLQLAYGFSKRVAMQSLPLLSPQELAILRERVDVGGLKKSK